MSQKDNFFFEWFKLRNGDHEVGGPQISENGLDVSQMGFQVRAGDEQIVNVLDACLPRPVRQGLEDEEAISPGQARKAVRGTSVCEGVMSIL